MIGLAIDYFQGYRIELPMGSDWRHYATGEPLTARHAMLDRAQDVVYHHYGAQPRPAGYGLRFSWPPEKYAAARMLCAGFTEEQIVECRTALRCIERDRWRDRDVPLIEIEAVLLAWRLSGCGLTLPFFVGRTPARQLVLL